MSVDLDKILLKNSGFHSNIRKCKDLYSRYIKVLKDKYGANWQDHMDLEQEKKKNILKGKVSYEDCNRYVADLLLTDYRQKEVLEEVYKSYNDEKEEEDKIEESISFVQKRGDKKYKAMRYWEYLPEYFYDYQSRYGCDFGLKYQEPEGVEKSAYLLQNCGKYAQNFVEAYRDNMREAIADFIDDPVNKQVRERLYDDYKYYANNCSIRARSKSYLANKIWDEGRRHNGSIEEQECYKYIKALNPYAIEKESHRVIRVAHKTDSNEMENWGVALKDAKDLACLQGENDIYIGQNIFSKHGSYTKDNVSHLNAVYVDLDYYKIRKMKPEVMTSYLKLLVFNKDIAIPEPSLYISSGRGLYLIWLLDFQHKKDDFENEKYWSNVEERLVNQFKDYGADMAVKDTTRILRLPGSINSKTGEVVKVIAGDLDNPKRYSLGEIYKALKQIEEQKEALKSDKPSEEDKPKTASTKKGEGFGLSVGNMHRMFLNRIHDLEQVVEYRRINGCNGIEETGWRDKLLFLHCLHNCYAGNTVDYAINKALELNQKLSVPLKERKLTSKKTTLTKAKNAYFRSIKNSKSYRVQNDGVYRYTTDKIIEMIELTEEEQANIEFLTLVSEEVRKERKKIKNAERYQAQLKAKGEKPKKDKMADVRKEIKKLLDQGLTQKRIAEELGLSLSTVKRRLKELQDENIIEFKEVNKNTENENITLNAVQNDQNEINMDFVGLSNCIGCQNYRGFDEQTVG